MIAPTVCPICGDEFPGWKSGDVHEHCLPCDLRAMKGERDAWPHQDGRHPGLREPEGLVSPAAGCERHQLQLMPRREPCRAVFDCRCSWHTGPNPAGQNMRADGHVPHDWCEECCVQARWELWAHDAFRMRTPRPQRIRILRAMGYTVREVAKLVGIAFQRVSEAEKHFRPVSLSRIAS